MNESAILTQRRTDHGRKMRKLYESGQTSEKWGAMSEMVPRTDGCSNTITTMTKDNYLIEMKKKKYRIRNLTPRECFRLMGVEDKNIDKIQEAGISESQQYKMAGNSIVVDVMTAMFENLFYPNEEEKTTLF